MLPTDDIVYLKGVGPQRAKVLAAEAGIRTVDDMLQYFPFRHIDRSHTKTIASVKEDDGIVVLHGTVGNIQIVSTGKYRERLTADLFDGTGYLQLVWFQGTKWVREKLKDGSKYVVIGTPTIFNGTWQMTIPKLRPRAAARQRRATSCRPPSCRSTIRPTR